jgi:hypothetical protein
VSGAHVALVVPGAAPAGNGVFWQGGIAAFSAIASAWNAATATLNVLGPDGATQQAVGSSTTVTANAFVTPLYLPPGIYTVTVTGGTPTALYVSLDRVPL